MSQGVKFEDAIMNWFEQNISNVEIIPPGPINDSLIELTKSKIKEKKASIISQAAFRDTELNIQGRPDILIRSDILEAMFGVTSTIKTKHYTVIDIKYKTINISSDGVYMTNDKDSMFYKTQLCCYTNMLNDIQQDVHVTTSYILPKRCKQGKKKSDKVFDKLGKVDFQGNDQHILYKTQQYIEWIKYAKENFHRLDISKPTSVTLLLNLACDSGKESNDIKNRIAMNTNDITQFWNITNQHRENLFTNGGMNALSNWHEMDKKTLFDYIGMKKGNKRNILEKMLDINSHNNTGIITPFKLNANQFVKTIHPCDRRKRCYVDFETFSDIFDTFETIPYLENNSQIFMIGCAFVDENDIVIYKDFTCDVSTHSDEKRIMEDFMSFVKEQGFEQIIYWVADKNILGIIV